MKPIDENESNHDLQEELGPIRTHYNHKPYWKRIHHTWSFWIFLVLMVVAILYYIMSVDFAFAPRKEMKQSTTGTSRSL